MEAATKGNVIDYGGNKADDDDDDGLVAELCIEPPGQCREHAVGGKGRHRQKDADEEHHRCHIDALEGLGQSEVIDLLFRFVAVQDVPQSAKERRAPAGCRDRAADA